MEKLVIEKLGHGGGVVVEWWWSGGGLEKPPGCALIRGALPVPVIFT
jgi:hypothetical protein